MRRAERLFGLLTTLASLSLPASPGFATPPPSSAPAASQPASQPASQRAAASGPKAEANRLFGEGNRLRKAKQHARALLQYQAAYRLFPSYKILLNMGLTLHDMGRLVEAAAFLERFTRRGTDQSPPEKLAVANDRLDDLKCRLARVWISCPLAAASVAVDGKVVGITPVARWIYLSPGQHTLLLTLKGYRPAVRRLSLRAGELRDLPVDLVLPAARAGELPPALMNKEPPTPPPPPPLSPEELEQTRRTKTTWGYSTLGVGLAALAGAAVLVYLGAVQGDKADSRYRNATRSYPPPSACELDDFDRDKEAARAKLVGGSVLAGAGIAALGVSAYLLLTRTAERPPRSSAWLAPAPGGATGGLRVRF